MKRIAWLFLSVLLSKNVFAVNPQPPTETPNYATQKTSYSSEDGGIGTEGINDEAIASYTLWLTRATWALVALAAGQIVVLIYANRTAGKTAEAAKKSADVAEIALTDVESPALYPVVSTAEFAKSLKFGHDPVLPVEIRLKNVGRLPGFPGIIVCVLFAGGPDEAITDRQAGWFPESTLTPGDTSINSVKRSICKYDGKIITDQDCAAIVKGTQDVYLSGTMTYMDLFGRQYRQTFCLKWLTEHEAFMAFGSGRNKRTRKQS